jgi:imidazolonepropionase
MRASVLVRGARQLLTLRGPACPRRGSDLRNLGIVQDGSVLIVDGLIREVGPTRRLENLTEARQAQEIDATGRVVLPGFVDSHTHLVSGLPRLVDHEMSFASSTPDGIARAEQRLHMIFRAIQDTSGHILETRASRLLNDCVRQGTTTIEAKSGYGVTETGELKVLRAHAALNEHYANLVSTFMAGHYKNASQATSAGSYLDWLCSFMLPLVKRRRLASFVDIACEEGRFSVAEARQYLARAKELGFGLKIHAGNAEGVRLAMEAGVTSVDHAMSLDSDVIALLAASSTIATLLPGPVFHRGAEQYPSARKLIDQGAAVALASDFNPETSPTHNMQMILSLACNKMNMTPAEAFTAGTINAAHALGLASKVGSIERGKQADLIILDIADYRELPYHFGGNLVAATMKKGKVIYRASEVQWASTN